MPHFASVDNHSDMPLCLVLGGGGFLGSHIVDRLVREGYRVRVLDRQETNPNLQHVADQIEMYSGSVTDDAVVKSCLSGVTFLFHYASSTLPATSNLNPEEDVRINLLATIRLLTEAVSSGVKKVVFPSSGGTVYGIPHYLPIPETHPTNPLCSYGIVKLAIEKYLALFERRHGLNYVVLRYGNPFGERQDPFRQFGAVPTFLGRLATGKPLEIWGDGSPVRDFIYVSDTVEATVKALHYSGEERIFNIGSGMGTSINQLVAIIQEVTGKHCEVVYSSPRSSAVPANVLDISKAKRELDWDPKVRLRDGIALTWNWICGQIRDQRDN